VEQKGHLSSPRNHPASAVYDVTTVIHDPVKAPPVGVRQGYAYRIAATETVQLLAGMSDLSQLDAASNGKFSQFADDGRLLGAYGPRLSAQLPRIETQLRADHDTRQAIANLWKPGDHLDAHDVPCTLSLTFRIIDGKLELKVHMRSNDVILGVPYDWFMFSRTQLAMAEVLGLPTGRYVHHVDNLHVYQRDEARARRFIAHGEQLDTDHSLGGEDQSGTVFTGGSVHPFTSWKQVQNAALTIAYGAELTNRRVPWFNDHVEPLTPHSVVCVRCQYVFKRDEDDTVRNVCYTCTGDR